MLYPKKEQPFSMEEFLHPGSEYRGTPFWAWNRRLDSAVISKQTDIFREMGFGGFHVHVRTGMDTPYLQKDFMNYVKQCSQLAKEKNMLLWLYDEDRWPSGAAGGYVTQEIRFRERFLRMSPYSKEGFEQNLQAFQEKCISGGEPYGYLLARYRVHLKDGLLSGYERLDADAPGESGIWYAYLELSSKSPWYNNQTYVNTLDKKAIDRFIEVTHEAYAEALGDEFSRTIPAIFTDEPQFKTKETFYFADEKREVILPFTDDLPETFRKAYGYDLLDRIPEIFWNMSSCSQVRYHYHDHICSRFVEAFPENIGNWCQTHGLALTGHVNAEQTLTTQTFSVGSAMRCYPHFQIPGIDMLCDGHEFSTAKQAQSIVHQCGREGMLSELYGVTNWDFDFKGHKLHGDWQAALGVTVRVPHLSWMSMEGEAKRDYPASIFYQSPWYQEYPLIEDHFARVNTAMTRGKCNVRIGVIHPIESFWLLWGPQQQSYNRTHQAEQDFADLIKWLLFGLADFDFIDESLLPEQTQGGVPITVGEMKYDVILLPPMLTIRQTTADILERFAQQGGDLIAFGDAPSLTDAIESDSGIRLWEQARRCPFDQYHLLQSLEDYRLIDIRNDRGVRTDHLLYQLRQDGEEQWLFICHVYRRKNGYEIPEGIQIRLRGNFRPQLYDTVAGSVRDVPFREENGWTVIELFFCAEDSLLFRLFPCGSAARIQSLSAGTALPPIITAVVPDDADASPDTVDVTLTASSDVTSASTDVSDIFPDTSWRQLPEPSAFELSEPNVLLLDMAEHSLNGEPFHPKDELLRIDNRVRSRLGYPCRMEHVAQPWVIQEKAEVNDRLQLRFRFSSEIVCEGALLALEPQAGQRITFNGAVITAEPVGYFTDECIRTLPLPPIRQGSNELLLEMNYTEKTNVEWCYLLGHFGVQVCGASASLTAFPANLVYGDITAQKLPFYGANIIYETKLETNGVDGVELFVPRFEGPVIRVWLDGRDAGPIAFAPHTLDLGCPSAGKHWLSLRLYGNRYNSFGCLHNTNTELTWFGPTCWRTQGNEWAYQYQLKPFGITQNPQIRFYSRKENPQ